MWEERGELRFSAVTILPTAGVGAQQLSFLQVKEALGRDGLLDPARKRRLPPFPSAVAIVTSVDGAAFQDMVTVARRRWPAVRLLLVPSAVQGEHAEAELVRALGVVNRLAVQVCVLGRGGGSREDLGAFNAEAVCRAVAAVRVPVVSAVGHETDVSLVDLVADVRAPTPSAAMELVLPERGEVAERVGILGARLAQGLRRRTRLVLERLHRSDDRLRHSVRARLERERERANRLGAQLDALSPLRVLERGYAVARGADGRVLRRRADFPPALPFRLRVSDGDVAARAEPPRE
jgi:exodeoxyribonuclease VII large subunit